MQRRVLRTCTLATLVLAGLDAATAEEKVSVEMKARDGKSLGTVELAQTPAGVLLKVKLTGLPPGAHGFHVHETGTCEGDFSSTGAIYNPLGAAHGFLTEDGPMAGDLVNLYADASGAVQSDVLTPFLTLTKDGDETVFDADGASLVIFEAADDYLTEPEGNAGERIACGVIPSGKS